MEVKNGVKTFHAKTRKAWRNWLSKFHEKEKSLWLIIYKKESGVESVYYPEAVEEALCFGWIDSKGNKRDDESYYQFFSKRNPKSKWSKLNNTIVKILIANNQIMPAGFEMITLAKKSGTWTALDKIDSLPDDLQQAFYKSKIAFTYWSEFPPSTKRGILEWISNAKRPETRKKRIDETVTLAGKNIRANQYVSSK